MSVTGVCAVVAALFGSLLVVATGATAYAFGSGNLLVSTSVYTDLPAITAGTTALPNNTTYTVSAVTTSGAAPNIVATITTAKNTWQIGQVVTIAAVVGATQVNGTWTILANPPPTTAAPYTFSISMGSTAVSPYTSGGTVSGSVAVAGQLYPTVFNNDTIDGNFGITEPITLDEIPATTSLVSTPLSTTTVPNSDTTAGDQMVTSFSSKSELALNLSTDGSMVTLMGYNAPTRSIDVSNSNTPIEKDPTNSDTAGPTSLTGYYRDVATMDGNGNFQFTDSGAYGGNNGRASILNSADNTLFLAGNAGNGANPPFQGVVVGAGSQIATQATTSQAAQETAGVPTPVPYGNFNIAQLGDAADKSTKDNNFRGLTQSNGVIYMSKGSGGNGVNTVYFVDTTGNACPTIGAGGGVGLPQAGASLPTIGTWTPPIFTNTTYAPLGLKASNPGLKPTNMCILNGFPTGLASPPVGSNYTVYYPFGMWFASSTTLYVADEGSGAGTAADTTGGLQKWVYNAGSGSWSLAYTLQSGLNLNTPYATAINPSPPGVNGDANPENYPTGTNGALGTGGGTGKAWTPANDGLRNIVGRTNGDGTVTVWGVTSTTSGSGDQGADPNSVVAITDNLAATTLPAAEAFTTVMAPTDGVVYRGVTFTPTGSAPPALPEVPWLPLVPMSATVLGGGYFWARRRRRVALPAA
jgi:hypothetical protein